MPKRWIPLALLLGVACGGSSPSPAGGTGGATAPAASLPEALYLPAAPAEAKDVIEAKKGAVVGQEVVLRGRVGGQAQPFVEGHAVAVIADLQGLTDCSRRPGDTCPVPWDYCCEAPEALLAGTATIQVIGEDGRVIKAGLKGWHGLKELSVVVVRGQVAAVSDQGLLQINVSGIHVEAP